jgi:hypothetical protein
MILSPLPALALHDSVLAPSMEDMLPNTADLSYKIFGIEDVGQR